MKIPVALLIAALLAGAGCGNDDDAPAGAGRQNDDVATTAEPEAEPERETRKPKRKGTKVTVRGSEFGRMLFDSKRQAIYIFERDSRNRTVCYGECARAWPPVLTKGRPRAGNGADAGLLGTIRRRSGRRQVTYAGQPLYYYAHEGPGEVLCHNVNLNGGFWWVVGPDGKRLA
jgi:predicted lipoprotein with Yx(FWY)xxD motif